MRFILMIIDRIDEVRTLAITFVGATTGSIMNVVSENNLASLKPTDPTWFCVASPILQTIAWGVAILAGLATFVKIMVSLFKHKKHED